MGHRMTAASWLLVAALGVGCSEETPGGEPVDAAPDPDMGRDAEMIDVGIDVGIDEGMPPPDATPGCPPPVFELDVAGYEAEIAGPLYDACSICHPAAEEPLPTFNMSGDAAADAAEAAEFVAPGCLLAPETCAIVAWHPEGHLGYVAEPLRGQLVGWIEGSTTIEPCDTPEPEPEPEPEPGPMPPEGVPCDALPPPGAQLARSQRYRDDFAALDADGVSHNDILVGSCARNGTCHAVAGFGDGYWLLEGTDACAIEWNFFISQIYIDLLNPPRSPLLTLPRDRLGHGGRSVFQGADDERHVRLLRWIEDEQIRSR